MLRKFPLYRQLDQMDCGPTCLRMVAKHYGRGYSAQNLRELAEIAKEGVSLLGISQAAEKIGFRTVGVKVSLQKLLTDAPLPCILHWDQNHFVVLVKSSPLAPRGGILRHFFRRKPASEVSTIENEGNNAEKAGSKTPPSGRYGVPEGGLDIKGGKNPYFEEGLEWRNPAPSAPEGGTLNTVFDSKTPPLGAGGLGRSIFHIADPAKGLVSYTAEEFCSHWLQGSAEGVALLLEPTPKFYEATGDTTKVLGLGSLLGYLFRFRPLIIQLFLGMLVGSGLGLVFPFLTQSVVDVGVNTRNLSFIYMVLAGQLMLMLGRLGVDFIRSWILLHISTRINLSILSSFLIKLMRLPLSFFDVKLFGDLMQRIGDHHRIEAFLTNQTLNIVFSLFNLVVYGLVLAVFNVQIFLIFMGASVAYSLWVVAFLKYRRKLDYRHFEVAAKNQSILIQLIQGMQEIKLANAETQKRWEWEGVQAKLFRLNIKGLALSQYQQMGAFVINEGKNILITFFAAKAVLDGQMSLGAMLAVQQLVGQLNSPIEQMISFVQTLQDAKISLERLNEIHGLEDESSPLAPQGGTLIPKAVFKTPPSGRSDDSVGGLGLCISSLSYTYPGAGNEPVLQDITLDIPIGKTTAILGTSGSGKTTLLKLLLKFYKIEKGDIHLGHTPFKAIDPKYWRSICGVVMQEGFIFSDTIANNIAVGQDRIDSAKLLNAVRIANIHEFVASLPLGFHTKIGAEGNGISQGQKQRLLIARAVYKDPDFLFFDEATNALDANNERTILKNLEDFLVEKTVIIVAHRLSTVQKADQIVVLDKGRIVEIGTHQSLSQARGKYYELVKNQLELGS